MSDCTGRISIEHDLVSASRGGFRISEGDAEAASVVHRAWHYRSISTSQSLLPPF
jgi:hypothetical protein